MKLLVSSLLFLLGKAVVAHDDCPAEEESGYEVWRSLPPRQARVQFEADVNCTTETYTLTYSFMPDYTLPYINDITKDDWNARKANPNMTEVCRAEGLGPGLQENVPNGTHVGENVHYTDYSYSYETSDQVRDATGFKLLTIGAGPCGTPTQPYPHYSVHFYTVDKSDREKMMCKSNGGYFCLPASEQCSSAAKKFNLDGEGIEKCEDGSYANVPPGFQWTIDNNPAIGINAGSPGMGLHGLIPSDLGGSYEEPLLLMVQYDAKIVANHIVLWGGLPLGQNNPGEDYSWEKSTTYNCQDMEKYPSLPHTTKVEYKKFPYGRGRTYISVTGPTDKCSESFTEYWSARGASKAGKNSKTTKKN